MDMEKYKKAYVSEAKRHIATMNNSLLELEKNPAEIEKTEEMFRALHTMKSMAATMHYDNVAKLCHAMEDIVDGIKNKKIELAGNTTDALFECFDFLDLSLKQISKNKSEGDVDVYLEGLKRITLGDEVKEEAGLAALPHKLEKIQVMEVDVKTLDTLMNLIEEMLILKLKLDQIKTDVKVEGLTYVVDSLARVVEDTQYNIIQARMVPVGFIFNRFPRMIRDLAKQENKQVNLVMDGTEIKLDRALVDEIGEPLIHLLRNAIDHGIESPEERKKAGKKSEGTLRLSAKREKGYAIIEVEDDGKGLDLEEIKNSAVKQGRISSDRGNKGDIMDLLFAGFSTNKKVTNISGRGVGLNVVKRSVDNLGGEIKVESEPGQGTKFIMKLPLTLAIIKALLVGVGDQQYAIPVSSIERLVDVRKKDVKGIFNYETIIFDGEDIPLIKLNNIFTIESNADNDKQRIVVVKREEEKYGLGVDSLIGEQDIVVKPLNKAVKENRYFAGSTIIGSGKVILILDVANLVVLKKEVREEHSDEAQIKEEI
jgi:two-component system, chemotaxis family, sensor kinase CheA